MSSSKVKVLYFGHARDLAAISSETVAIPEGSTVHDLVLGIKKRHPALTGLGSSVKYSVNFEIAEGDMMLGEGDEVGVLPPVAGG